MKIYEKYCDYSILFDKLVGIEEQDGDITLEFEWGHKIFIKKLWICRRIL